ncbi:hypothetical protein L6164_033206 [Bauhinia variegata]|uniref:Uncharacterized protein n=1 Tax=Bauhinia variegata TaxID=167791 RepID=A0ACB9KRQ6_BAUVA|nr:hypothetical protein L6164_033206 [Bauhinia variegata]
MRVTGVLLLLIGDNKDGLRIPHDPDYQNIVPDWFKIQQYHEDYKLVFCPMSGFGCSNVGVYVDEDGNRRVDATAPSAKLSSHFGISQSRPNKAHDSTQKLQSSSVSVFKRSMLYAASALNFCIADPRKPPCLNYRRTHSVAIRCSVHSSVLNNNNDAKVEYTPWLIVGLGNPGNKYHGTRHNVGFEMIDRISEAQGILMNTIQSKALIGIGSIGVVPILLAKPQTYMNFSGEAVGPLAAYYQVPLRHILLVYDEMSLPNGILRLQRKGGHGHHNGLKNVIGHLDGSHSFPRLCVGIGNPPGTMDVKAYLLQKFSSVERNQIDAALEPGVEAVRNLVLHGFNPQVNRFNLGQKYKYHKV